MVCVILVMTISVSCPSQRFGAIDLSTSYVLTYRRHHDASMDNHEDVFIVFNVLNSYSTTAI